LTGEGAEKAYPVVPGDEDELSKAVGADGRHSQNSSQLILNHGIPHPKQSKNGPELPRLSPSFGYAGPNLGQRDKP